MTPESAEFLMIFGIVWGACSFVGFVVSVIAFSRDDEITLGSIGTIIGNSVCGPITIFLLTLILLEHASLWIKKHSGIVIWKRKKHQD